MTDPFEPDERASRLASWGKTPDHGMHTADKFADQFARMFGSLPIEPE